MSHTLTILSEYFDGHDIGVSRGEKGSLPPSMHDLHQGVVTHSVADDGRHAPLQGPEGGIHLGLHSPRASQTLLAKLHLLLVLGVERVQNSGIALPVMTQKNK